MAKEDFDGEATLIERLRTLVEVERAHLDPESTFDVFVRRMGAPERAVRRLINHRLGYDHFRSFLNAYRMVEARRLLADPIRASDKLISIAMDSGFASLASFNRVFRATEAVRLARIATPAARQRHRSRCRQACIRVLRSVRLAFEEPAPPFPANGWRNRNE